MKTKQINKKNKSKIDNVIFYVDILEKIQNKFNQGKKLNDKEKRWFGILYNWNKVSIEIMEMIKKIRE